MEGNCMIQLLGCLLGIAALLWLGVIIVLIGEDKGGK